MKREDVKRVLNLGEAVVFQCFVLLEHGMNPLDPSNIKNMINETLDLVDTTRDEIIQCLEWLGGASGGGCYGEFFRSFRDSNGSLSTTAISTFLKQRELI